MTNAFRCFLAVGFLTCSSAAVSANCGCQTDFRATKDSVTNTNPEEIKAARTKCEFPVKATMAEWYNASCPKGLLQFDGSWFLEADFRGADLRRWEMPRASLEEANFSHATFGTIPYNMTGISARGATFDHAVSMDGDTQNEDIVSGGGTNFLGANLESSSFLKVKMLGAVFNNANLQNADFTGAILDNTNFVEAMLVDAKFTNSSLKNTRFVKANMVSVDMRGVKAPIGMNLAGADLTGAQFGPDFDFSSVIFCRTKKVDWLVNYKDKWSFEASIAEDGEEDEEGVEIIYAGTCFPSDLGDNQFRQTSFEGATISDSGMMKVNISNLNFKRANLNGTFLDKSNMRGTVLTKASMQNANLAKVNLENADLRKSDLTGAILTGAFLDGADLSGANFTDANLTNADLTDVKLDLAIFKGANLTGATMPITDWHTRVYLCNTVLPDKTIANPKCTK